MKVRDRKKPFTAEEFEDIYSRVPRLTVEVLLKMPSGVVLALREEDSWKGMWHIPGGTVFYQETLEDAVQRVAKEEIGVAVSIDKQIGHIHYPSEVKERGFGWSIGIVFLCSMQNDASDSFEEKYNVRAIAELPENVIEEQKEVLQSVLRSA